MQLMLFAAETPPDPIWLRTLATVLPVVATIAVALVTGPKLVERMRERRNGRDEPDLIPPREGPGVPAPVVVAATERASTDPIIRLFIDDLHARLSLAHEEAAELHRLRAVDAGTIARLTTEIGDKEDRLRDCERQLADKNIQNRQLIRRLEELKRELDATRRKLAICIETHHAREN